MKRIVPLGVLILAAAAIQPGAAQAASATDLVKQAVAAEGGANALRSLKTLAIKAEATHWEPEQSDLVDGPPRPLGNSTITVAWDLEHGMVRREVDHTMLYPFPGKEKYTEIITPGMGEVIDDNGPRAMSGARLAFDQRELERASPVLLLKALDAQMSVKALPDQTLAGKRLPAVAFADGGTTFTILFDPKTHLPAAIRTAEDDDVHGDGHFDLMPGDWKSVGGAMVATSLHYAFNGLDKLKVSETEVTPNAPLAGDAFAMADAVKQAAKGPATGDQPWQAMLVRQNFGRWNDLQAEKEAQEGLVMKLAELAPNIQQALGRTHNSLIVAMPHYLVVFDAPQNEAQSRWTIDAAKAKYPGKPIKYVMLTHHHMDHIGGIRTYVAEGATVIIGKPDKAHMERVLKAPHTMHPDELQRHPRPGAVIEVGGKMALKDGGQEIDFFRIENPHAQGMLIGYVLPEKLVWVTDLYSPGRDKAKTPGNAAFFETIKKLGISPERYAGGHGSSGTQAEFTAIEAAK